MKSSVDGKKTKIPSQINEIWDWSSAGRKLPDKELFYTKRKQKKERKQRNLCTALLLAPLALELIKWDSYKQHWHLNSRYVTCMTSDCHSVSLETDRGQLKSMVEIYTECKYGGPLGRRPGRVMKVRLVRPRCFVLTMFPLKSLASWTV